MSKPTKETIEETIKQLKEMRPKIRHYSVFGDDNRAAVAAQINVLENDLDTDQIADEYDCADESEYIYESAIQAREWLDGEVEENLVDDWNILVKNN